MFVPALLTMLFLQQGLPPMPTGPVVVTKSTDSTAANDVKVHIDSTMRVTYTLKPEEPTREVAAKFLCYHMCKGDKHLSHDRCDASCDEECPFPLHLRAIPIELDEPDWIRFQALTPIEERLALLGHNTSDLAWLSPPGEMAFLDTLQQTLAPYFERSMTISLPHFANPCSEAQRTIGYKRYSVMAHVVCESVVTRGTERNTYTRTTDMNVTSMFVPDASVVLNDRQKSNCVCEDPMSWPKDPPKIDDIFPRTPNYIPLIRGIEFGPDFKDIFWKARGMALVEYTFGDGDFDPKGGFYLPPGTMWEDWEDDEDYQDLVQLNPYIMYFTEGSGPVEPESHDPRIAIHEPQLTTHESQPTNHEPRHTTRDSRITNHNPRITTHDSRTTTHEPRFTTHDPQAERDPLMTACTELHKKAPDGRRMKMKPVQDQVLQQIAMLSQNDMIRGLYDQVRVWIYTDHATMDEVNKVLLPKTTKSGYVRSLYDDFRVGALDVSKPEVKRLFEPALVDCPTAPPAAQKWFVNRMSMMNGKALAEYMAGPGASMADALKNDAEVKGLAQIVDALASAASPEVHAAFPKWCEAIFASPKGKDIAAMSKWWTAAKKLLPAM